MYVCTTARPRLPGHCCPNALRPNLTDVPPNVERTRYEEVLTFLLDAEELLGIYGLHVPDLSLPAAHGFDT